MIIIEGPNGVGKTTYVTKLSKALQAPVYRAFKRPGNLHYGEERKKFEAMGVPVNTFVDDMYLADMSRILKYDVIVDRSMPSAIAYEQVEKQNTFKVGNWYEYSLEWEHLMRYSLTPVLLVRLTAPYSVALPRMTGHVPSEEAYNEITGWLIRVFKELTRLPQYIIDTSQIEVDDGVSSVQKRLQWAREEWVTEP